MEYARATGTPGLLEVNAPLIEEQAEHRGLVDRASAQHVAERAFNAAHVLLAVSEEVAEYLKRYSMARDKVQVVPNGVNPDRFAPNQKPSLPTAAETLTVGFAGSMKPWHGLENLLEAFARLHQRLPASRLLLVGGPPFPETILMWWNFVARTPLEIADARTDWEERRRFGDVTGYSGPRLAAPSLIKFANPNPVS